MFVFSAIASVVAAAGIALRVREEGYERRVHPSQLQDLTTLPPDSPYLEGRQAADLAADASAPSGRPMRLLNRGLIAALVINLGGYYAGGTYEVIWSLFLEGLGADLALIGLTFAMFGLPVLLLSPFAGRVVDRRGSLAFIVLGSILPAVTGILYTFLSDPVLAVPLILVEATGFAFLNPALYSVVAASSPPGRSSTAQGLFGAAGSLGSSRPRSRPGSSPTEHPVPLLRVQRLHDTDPRGRARHRRAAPDGQTGPRASRGWRLTDSARMPIIPERGGAAAARRAHNPKVTGSNPVPATNAFS